MTFEEWYIKTYPTGNVRPLIDIKGIVENTWDAAAAQSAAEIESLLYEVERLKAENERLRKQIGVK